MDIQMARQLEEEIERDAQRMNEQIARDAEVARIHVEEELQMMINSLDRSNETVLKYLQEYEQFTEDLSIGERKPWSKKQNRDYYMAVIKSNLGWKVKDFRGMTFEEIESKFTTVWKQIKNFILMGSKEEADRFKKKGISSASYQFFVDLLKHLDMEDLNQLWTLVKESLNIRPALSDKEMELWVELKRLYEPDVEDQLEGLPSEEGSGNCDDYYKLQVENYSQMANDLILKIYKIASSPSQKDD
uniref:Uncharacterized protein n=1 Tax=Tanacetum cinerariifolium TaxID=118510 RepID=A0A699HBW4_TANCI|nr:hypothetical protein [Tanacetum cinerariifolium]